MNYINKLSSIAEFVYEIKRVQEKCQSEIFL